MQVTLPPGTPSTAEATRYWAAIPEDRQPFVAWGRHAVAAFRHLERAAEAREWSVAGMHGDEIMGGLRGWEAEYKDEAREKVDALFRWLGEPWLGHARLRHAAIEAIRTRNEMAGVLAGKT